MAIMNKITYKQIAQQLNISQATVTMVMNNRPGVSENTRQRVLAAALEAGYKPKSKNVDTVGSVALLIGDMEARGLVDNPYFSVICDTMHQTAISRHFTFSIKYVSRVEDIDDPSIDGYILLASVMSQDRIITFTKTKHPIVVLDNSKAFDYADTVVIDNENGIKKVMEHLISLGHRRVGYIQSDPALHNFTERFEAYKRHMNRCQYPISADDIINVGIDLQRIQLQVYEACKVKTSFPTAFIADNDFIALAAQSALRELGIVVGKDVALVGFDDIPFSKIADVPLTTVKTFNDELGKVSVERLIELIEKPSPPRKYTISTKLVIRDSTIKYAAN